MNKVATINLGGNAYQLEEGAYQALQKYLASAEANLKGDPDKQEVMNDFEQAIAEKCDQHLNKDKRVVTEIDMRQILKTMGPVEVDEQDEKNATPPSVKRLYLLREEGMIGGVCAGLAAYFNIDVTVVRVAFVLLTILSSGLWILVYLLLMLLLPGADTPEQIAAAHGESFNAQELLGKAKLKYANLRVGENVKHSVEVAKPALSDLGTLLRDIVRLVSLSLAIFTSLIIAALTICWGVLTWALLFNNYHLPDQLSGISTIALLIAGIGAYYILLLPLVLVEQMFQRMGAKVRKNIAKPAFWALVVATLLWLVAAVSLIAVGISNQSLIKSYYDTHHNRPNTECIYNEPNIMYYPGNPVACPCNTNMLYGSRAVPCPLL